DHRTDAPLAGGRGHREHRLQGASEGRCPRARPSRLPGDRAGGCARIAHGADALRRRDRRALLVAAACAAELPAAGARGRVRLGAREVQVGAGARRHAAGVHGLRRGVRVNLAQLRERIALANSWLLAAVFFCIPVQVAPAYVLSAAMLALWVIEGRVGGKLRALAAEPLVRIMLGYYGVLLL